VGFASRCFTNLTHNFQDRIGQIDFGCPVFPTPVAYLTLTDWVCLMQTFNILLAIRFAHDRLTGSIRIANMD
jgi:hypothetical protein